MMPYSDQDCLDISKERRDQPLPSPPSPLLPRTHIYHRNLGLKNKDRQSCIR